MTDCVSCGEPDSTTKHRGQVYCAECCAKLELKDKDDITYDSNDNKNKELPFLRFFSLICICSVIYFFKQGQ
mgnify:CR=1 FL=1